MSSCVSWPRAHSCGAAVRFGVAQLVVVAGGYEEHPEDDRNRRSADGLRSLASHVHSLEDDDERLYVLAALDADHDEAFEPGDETERLTRRFHFRSAQREPGRLFERFIDALSRDRGLRHR